MSFGLPVRPSVTHSSTPFMATKSKLSGLKAFLTEPLLHEPDALQNGFQRDKHDGSTERGHEMWFQCPLVRQRRAGGRLTSRATTYRKKSYSAPGRDLSLIR